MLNEHVLKGIGLAVTVLGYGVSLAGNWVSGKQLDMQVERKVIEILKKQK